MDEIIMDGDNFMRREMSYIYEDLGLNDVILADANTVDPMLLLASPVKMEEPTPDVTRNLEFAGNSSTSEDNTECVASQVNSNNPEELEKGAGELGECFSEHIEITTTMGTLLNILEKRFNCSLHDHEIWLQNTEKLALDKNLVDQCCVRKGLVQISMEFVQIEGEKRINIVDVLLPAVTHQQTDSSKPEPVSHPSPSTNDVEKKATSDDSFWEEDHKFFAELKSRNIPTCVEQWRPDHVQFWLKWVSTKFKKVVVRAKDFNTITGQMLCDMSREEFEIKFKSDDAEALWNHLEFLRRDGIFLVCVREKETDGTPDGTTGKACGSDAGTSTPVQVAIVAPMQQHTHAHAPVLVKVDAGVRSPPQRKSRILGCSQLITDRKASGKMEGLVGNNGQITLWQFLLELLTDFRYTQFIFFICKDGQFRLNEPDQVAELWGQRKNKPNMTYEKLSRALRYYYDGDMIAKVIGKRFVYKFVCDLKFVLGYSPEEIARNVFITSLELGGTYPGPIFFDT